VLYQVPDTSAPSPGQAATLIQSDQFISSQFTLLGSSGSRVIQGNVQLIPIGRAIMYVRPVWILGEGTTTFPRYLAVAAAVGQRAVLGFDMNDAVTALVTGDPTRLQTSGGVKSIIGGTNGAATTTTTTTVPGTQTTSPPTNASVNQLLQAAADEYAAGQTALAKKDLAGYQQHNARVDALVRAALAKSGITTTTTVPSSSTTVSASTPTTVAP
jgi:uncharacterized membrane protein (UPF0182 family)